MSTLQNNHSCPISSEKIDSSIIRISAFFIGILMALYLYTSEIVFLYILVVDFLTRIYLNKSYSIVFQISQFVKNFLKVKTNYTDNAPKKVAAKFGLLLLSILLVGSLQNYQLLINITASIFLFCAGLEFGFDCCIGCKIYYISYKGFAHDKNF